MIQMYMDKISVTIKPSFYLGICFMLLLMPVNWFLAWFIAALFHELCHYIAIKAMKYNMHSLKVDLSGMTITTDNMTYAHEMLVAMSGPIGGLSLLLFARCIPTIALCALFQSAYNLIPIFPYDGGRALRSLLLSVFIGEKGERIFKAIEMIFLLLLTLTTVYLVLKYNLDCFPILLLLSVLLKNRIIKIPCKTNKHAVQYSTQIIRG